MVNEKKVFVDMKEDVVYIRKDRLESEGARSSDGAGSAGEAGYLNGKRAVENVFQHYLANHLGSVLGNLTIYRMDGNSGLGDLEDVAGSVNYFLNDIRRKKTEDVAPRLGGRRAEDRALEAMVQEDIDSGSSAFWDGREKGMKEAIGYACSYLTPLVEGMYEELNNAGDDKYARKIEKAIDGIHDLCMNTFSKKYLMENDGGAPSLASPLAA